MTGKENITFLVIAAICISSANADTWASEVGRFSKGRTVSILTFKDMKKGASGGISLLGTYASFLGSVFIAVIAMILFSMYLGYHLEIYIYGSIIALGGFIGSIIDSYLGILIQEKYRKIGNEEVFEKVDDRKNYIRISGIKYINNDAINFISALLISALFTIILL
jgi:uncharacterized protein (TIGR00297 family)